MEKYLEISWGETLAQVPKKSGIQDRFTFKNVPLTDGFEEFFTDSEGNCLPEGTLATFEIHLDDAEWNSRKDTYDVYANVYITVGEQVEETTLAEIEDSLEPWVLEEIQEAFVRWIEKENEGWTGDPWIDNGVSWKDFA